MNADPAIRDAYRVLGLVPEADPVVVRAAYRALAQAFHPDRHAEGAKGLATARMSAINVAYSLIRNGRQLIRRDPDLGPREFFDLTVFDSSLRRVSPELWREFRRRGQEPRASDESGVNGRCAALRFLALYFAEDAPLALQLVAAGDSSGLRNLNEVAALRRSRRAGREA